jgi:hypothetical protein
MNIDKYTLELREAHATIKLTARVTYPGNLEKATATVRAKIVNGKIASPILEDTDHPLLAQLTHAQLSEFLCEPPDGRALLAVKYSSPAITPEYSWRKAVVDLLLKRTGDVHLNSTDWRVSLPRQLREDLLAFKAQASEDEWLNLWGSDFDCAKDKPLLGFEVRDWDADGFVLYFAR